MKNLLVLKCVLLTICTVSAQSTKNQIITQYITNSKSSQEISQSPPPNKICKLKQKKLAHKNQAPGYFRFTLGEYQITSIYDGYATGDSSSYFGQEPQKTEAVWVNNFSDTFTRDGKLIIKAPSNLFLINTNKELILIDAGSGNSLEPSMGFAPKNIVASGYKTKDISKILITHAHPDHANGLTIDGKMIYPNATVYLNKADYDFWIMVTPNLKAVFEPYQKKNQFVLFNTGDKITDEVTTVPLHGHTSGHTGYEISSNGEKMLFWGDIIHDADVQLSNMDVEIILGKYDETRVTQEINTAKEIVDKVAKSKELIGGAHLPFPGIGHVIDNETTTGYRWIPVHYDGTK
jgi:glyoxylase-like metal-dependent hydrolase (beta-lactamase superfamily II)